jgi:hypothetical protein
MTGLDEENFEVYISATRVLRFVRYAATRQ